MNKEQAINYLKSSGFSDEQINEVKQAFTADIYTELDKAIEEVKTERDKCYLDEYCYSHGWGMQSALEIFERHIRGAKNGKV
jgi:hypothetical protein